MIQKRLKQLQAESNRRDAKIYANMFSRITKYTDIPTKVCIYSFWVVSIGIELEKIKALLMSGHACICVSFLLP